MESPLTNEDFVMITNTKAKKSLTKITGIFVFAGCLASQTHAELIHNKTIETAITKAAYTYSLNQLSDFSKSAEGYNKAYALYRQAQLTYNKNSPADLLTMLTEAQNLLNTENDSEAKLLLAAIYGLRLGINPQEGAELGPKIQPLLIAAQANPSSKGRALLIEGVSLLFMPAAYGGGASQAEQILQNSLNAFNQQDSNNASSEVSWGKVETYVWLGKALALQGKSEDAKIAFQQALQIDPHCLWINHFAKESNITVGLN
jgi:tetratricopeptide (TPR) repeat protein